MQRMSSVLTLPYVGLGVVADAKIRGTSYYQQCTACLLQLTHQHVSVLIVKHTKAHYSQMKYKQNYIKHELHFFKFVSFFDNII